MYGSKAQYLYDLLKEKGIIGAQGSIRLELLDTEVNVNDKSAAGNLIQEWLGQWMTLNGVYHRVDTNSQIFPDYYLGENNQTDLLEVKTFDYVKSPNFDVAQFDAYVRSLRDQAYKLDADYLILGYSLSNGVLKINDIWLKKIWEITCPSEQFAVKTQVKQGKIHNIRPYNFKTMSRGFQPFESRIAFVKAIRNTLADYSHNTIDPDEWLEAVGSGYTSFSKTQL